ncbi:unnamed protein product [Gongylonema pulchrum]|uniref:EGF-like domain-containing protein n=1 Tax=Gongylonema pulchrum TaxID=637853 RepID=A0A3P6T5T8_9BILA|nr:unnamed protein product [Gongylonema pulchrum]
MMNDSHECEDVDECLEEGRCGGEHSKCINTEGSYDCTCEEGFVKNSNGACDIDVRGKFHFVLH